MSAGVASIASFIAVDVDYRATVAVAAAVGFTSWTDSAAAWEVVVRSTDPPAAYEPGNFFRRELPYLLAVLAAAPHAITAATTIVIDGFATLDAGRDGLGAHLRAALAAHPCIVGVAKRRYHGGGVGTPIVRGRSAVALHVTAAGLAEADAARAIAAMHGEHRVPTLLRRVDRLARDG